MSDLVNPEQVVQAVLPRYKVGPRADVEGILQGAIVSACLSHLSRLNTSTFIRLSVSPEWEENSDEHFIGSEVPGVEPTPEGGFKDSGGKIKKQAARFRVYAFGEDSKVLGEITSKDYIMNWTAHVANKKAAWVVFQSKNEKKWQLRNEKPNEWLIPPTTYEEASARTNLRTNLIVDSGEKFIEGVKAQPVALEGKFHDSSPVKLGEMRTDEAGRLLILAADGSCFFSAGTFNVKGFDNNNLVDKICDGTIRVEVKHRQSGKKISGKNGATVITAPPRFASGTQAPTTLYDLIENVYEQSHSGDRHDAGEVDYYRDIYPLFKRMYLLSWTSKTADQGHGLKKKVIFDNPILSNPAIGEKERKAIMDRIRAPAADGDAPNVQLPDTQANMPQLNGDEFPGATQNQWASLTKLQYNRLQKWRDGHFITGKKKPPYKSFNEIPLQEQPAALTRSALEWSIGAPLLPGIEVFWFAQDPRLYKLKEKYRFADTVTPGDLTKGLSLPWQADFQQCGENWWPSVRPNDVVTEDFFNRAASGPAPLPLTRRFTERSAWDRGIKNESDMVHNWTKLGFVSRHVYDNDPDQPEVLTEKQRDPLLSTA